MEILHGGTVLKLTGNAWKRLTQEFAITSTTGLEFDFASSFKGEIHGIGFDDNFVVDDRERFFQIGGIEDGSALMMIEPPERYSAEGIFKAS